MVQATISDKNLVMALYVLNLAQGATLLCMSIKTNIINRYLYTAVKLSTAAHQMDPRLDIYRKKSEYIKKVLREQKCWEDISNRREPVTSDMIEEIRETCNNLDSDSLESYLLDWNILGQYLGFRLSEWAQNEENKKNFSLKAIDNTPLAFTFKDF